MKQQQQCEVVAPVMWNNNSSMKQKHQRMKQHNHKVVALWSSSTNTK
jgi:hypothetical protein